jgi:asparagine synthase (glutamine-hydrolysing)
MLSVLWPYGPAASEMWSDPVSALGRCLLRVVPEDSLARPSIHRPGDDLCIVCCSRLDNRRDLARQLCLPDSETLSDDSVLVKAWERWGEGFLDHLDGAFTVLVLNLKTHQLFAARDHSGEYPLYFHNGTNFIGVASMPRALFTLMNGPPPLDEQRIADWLVQGPARRQASFFEGIQTLPPGHFLKTSGSEISVQEYWHPSKVKKIHFRRDSDYAEALSEVIDRVTEARLRTSGDAATQLSSGLDSAAVTASAASLLARDGRPLTAYTYVPQPAYTQDSGQWVGDEGPGAAIVAAYYPNIRHVRFTTEGQDLLGTLHAVGSWFDEPMMNLTNWVWILCMLQHAQANQIGTILQGGMGNSTISFGSVEPLTRWFRQGHWVKLLRTVLEGRTNGETSFKASARIALTGLYPKAWNVPFEHANSGPSLDYLALNPEFSARYELPQKWRWRNSEMPWNLEEQRMHFEENDLAQASMAGKALTGVELRDPTASRRIWEFCLSIPLDQYIAGGRTRSLVRRAMQDRLPAATLALKLPGMQGADWYLTMAPWMAELRRMLDWIEQSPAACRVLDINELKRRADNFPTTRLQKEKTHDFWHIGLLQGISLGTFLRTHDPEAPPAGDWYGEIKAGRR